MNLCPKELYYAEKKLDEFPDKEKYLKKDRDMKRLTEIERKRQKLDKPDLEFIYELNGTIKGFGYQKDPRIEEIRKQRNIKEDQLIIFGTLEKPATPDQIARSVDEVNETTVAYIGTWNPEIFNRIKQYPNIKHLYESFPDKKIFYMTMETDPEVNSPETAEAKLKEKSIYLSAFGKDLLYKTEFSKQKESYELVRFSVSDLGFPNCATTDEIYKKAQELGLKLCPAEVGPHLRLATDSKEWMLIVMNQITDRGGGPGVFSLLEDGAELGLSGDFAEPGGRWGSDDSFVFLARKS